jgi:hypothetical protein
VLADDESSEALDEGRMFVDIIPAVDISGDTTPYYEAKVYDPNDNWVQFASKIPENAIILWDQATGDEDCDGTPSAAEGDRCPCGYTEVTGLMGLTLRIADPNGDYAAIPDVPGNACDEQFGTGEGTGCSAPKTGAYDDVTDPNEGPTHNHTFDVDNWGISGNGVGILTGDQDEGDNTTVIHNAGSDDPHYHPFYSVILCRKT